MRLKTPTAILFDWDTTLVDNWNGIVRAWNRALAQLGREGTMTRETAIRLSAKPPHEIFLDVFGADGAQAGASTFYTHLSSARGMESLGIMEGSAEMLAALHAAGMPMGIVSNKGGFALREEIEHLGWGKFFFAAIGAGDAANDKPHPAPILYALEQRMIPPSPDVWMVGDMHSDIQAAKRAGITGVLIETTAGLGLGLEGDLTDWPPDFRVRNASALWELVKDLPHTI